MDYTRDLLARRLDTFEVAGERAAMLYDPAGKPDGALPSTFAADTGQDMTAFASPSNGAPLTISSGLVVNTTSGGGTSAGYTQVDLKRRLHRIGCMASWDNNALGVVALVIPSAPWSTGILPNAAFHLSVNGNGVWTLIRFTTGGQTTIASSSTHGRPRGAWGLGMVPIDVVIDPDNSRAVIVWWDGSRSVINSSYFQSETANYGIWELFANVGGTDIGAKFGLLWASGAPVTRDTKISPIAQNGSTASVAYNAFGTVNPDFTKSRIHQITLTGDITSMIFLNAPNQHEVVELDLIQDATGGRILSGVDQSIRWAGNAVPTLSTTPGRRDIFQFRCVGSNWIEVSRSMNVNA